MSLFIRRFTFDPGIQVFLEIEAVNVLDLTPPASITGVGTGTAMIVGEFEDGPFNTPIEVTSATDLASQFGGFGYAYNGVSGLNPCARARYADGAVVPEYWNGNGMIALNGKKFARLLITRVDTSVGTVDFERNAWMNGGSNFSYALTPGDTMIFGDALSSHTATFNAAAATLTSAAGSYGGGTGFVGGESMTIVRDGNTAVVVFQASDQTQALVVARINAALGYAAAVDIGGSVTTLSSLVNGKSASIAITSINALVATATGFSAGSAVGTGNVDNVAQVRPEEISAIVAAASANSFTVTQLPNGQIRLENIGQTITGVARVTGGTATSTLGFAENQNAAWQDTPTAISINALEPEVASALGLAVTANPQSVIVSTAGAYGSVAGKTITFQVSGKAPKLVTFQATDTTQALMLARINYTLGYTAAVAQSGTIVAVAGPGNNASSIPAGTRVRDTGGNEWVTMQTTAVSANNPGPYKLAVRPALDDGSYAAAPALSVNVLPYPIASSAFSVFNPVALSAALSENTLDLNYMAALDATLNPATVAAQTNLIWCARQSNTVRTALKNNVNDAAAGGLYGRMAAVRPPLGTTTRAMAESSAAQPGVGAYRDQRVIYTFPGVQTFVPAISALGLSGGAGFTANGIIDVGADGFIVSVCSQLPPEENPGQTTTYAIGAVGIEAGNADVQKLSIGDYTRFRANGICAPRMDAGTMIFQSGVTSVDPAVDPSLRNIARRRMADFIQDSIAIRMKAFGKQLNTPLRRGLIAGEIRAFLNGLLSPGNAAAQRIDGFSLDNKTGNTPDTLALGIYRLILNVRTLSSLDAIVLQTTIGETVSVSTV